MQWRDTMRHDILSLRVKKTVSGSIFPFDKVYFFPIEQEKIIPEVFQTAFVILPNKKFSKLLSNVRTESECKTGKSYTFDRSQISNRARHFNGNVEIKKIIKYYKDYISVIPILYLRRMDNGGSRPAYLFAQPKLPKNYRRVYSYMPRHVSAQSAINSNTKYLSSNVYSVTKSYMLYRKQKIQPICSVCPNSLSMITGGCSFGDGACYRHLSRLDSTTFADNMNNYLKWIRFLYEPGVKDTFEEQSHG